MEATLTAAGSMDTARGHATAGSMADARGYAANLAGDTTKR